MLPLLSLLPISVMSFFSMCADEIVDTISKDYSISKVVNFYPKDRGLENSKILNSTENNSSKILNISEPNNQLNNVEVDTHIRILHWKLKKNLETLVFLSELESRYTNKNVLLEMIHEYYSIKKTVQIETVEISNEIAYYKSLQNKYA